MDSTKRMGANNPSIKSQPSANPQGIATLIVMIAVLFIIILFCCFAAPGIRGMCKRYVFRTCAIDDPDIDNDSRFTEETSPTIILLPYGRMLVVDRRVLSQLQAHNSMELMEVNADFIREQRQLGSTPSILDSSETSKGISPTSLGFPPPSYGEVFPDFPPSYSEISLMMKHCESISLENLRTFIVDERNSGCDNFHGDSNVNREETTCFQESYHLDDNNNSGEVQDEDQMNNNVLADGHIEFVQEL